MKKPEINLETGEILLDGKPLLAGEPVTVRLSNGDIIKGNIENDPSKGLFIPNPTYGPLIDESMLIERN